ncbi:mucin-13-like [Ischnura elegans]|uniref:mucin-13-like n=1 Tax=Ischnura elegans TaxID=197161 RepID=UPI001ED8B9B5|nr:mucin-13-like [Ischnura elegans]
MQHLADEPSSTSDAPSSSSVATSGATGATSEGTPATGATSEGSTASGSTSEGTPATGSTSEGTAATGSTSEGTAATGSTSEGTPATGPTTTETGSTEVTTTATPGTTTPMPSPCTSGAGAYPVTGDCRKYYLCYLQPDGTMGHREMRCRDGSHFDGGARRCVAGACTDFPSTASTESTSPTPTPISCTSDGAVADEGCCKCYYICYNVGGSLNYVHKCCRQGSHFDGSMRRCVAGDKCTPTTTCAANRDEI